MFTGIIEGVGKIESIKLRDDGAEIEVCCDFDLDKTNVGDSISVNGCCLTVTSRLGNRFWADVSNETLKKTTLGKLSRGKSVNLERALAVGARMGGHIVQGHIDATGKVVDIKDVSGHREFSIEIPRNLLKYIVEKGSVAVDGVSLTVNEVADGYFKVNVIPHTKLATTFASMSRGCDVNLEVDIIGKYVERMRFIDSEQYEKKSKVTEEFLKKHGF